MWSIGRSYSKLTEELKAEAKLFRDALFAEAKKVKLSRKQIKKGIRENLVVEEANSFD